jgi:L-asparagine transporter-like permease
MTDVRYAPPTAQVGEPQSQQVSPPLWNPGAASAWSLLFSPIFGSFLHMKNWQALGEPQKAATEKTWCIASLAFILLIVLLGVVLPESKAMDQLSRIAGLALLIAWYTVSAKHQVAYVKARFGKDYPRRGWLKPLGLAVLALLGLIVFATVLLLVAEMVTGTAPQ